MSIFGPSGSSSLSDASLSRSSMRPRVRGRVKIPDWALALKDKTRVADLELALKRFRDRDAASAWAFTQYREALGVSSARKMAEHLVPLFRERNRKEASAAAALNTRRAKKFIEYSILEEIGDESDAVSYTHLTLPTNREV